VAIKEEFMSDEITTDQKNKIEEAFRNFNRTAPIGVKGTKDDFCRRWPELKSVLEFVRDLPGIPQAVRTAIGTVIAAGDTLHNIIC
jgi:hypothetical protein